MFHTPLYAAGRLPQPGLPPLSIKMLKVATVIAGRVFYSTAHLKLVLPIRFL